MSQRLMFAVTGNYQQHVIARAKALCMSPHEYLRDLIRQDMMATNKPRSSKVSAKRGFHTVKVQPEPALDELELDDMLTDDERLTIEEQGRAHREATIDQF